MRAISLLAVALVASAINGAQLAKAQNGGATGGAMSSATNAAAPVLTEQTDRLLRQMGEYVGSAEQFTFHADITFDHVLPSGQKLQYSASEDVALQRPGRLYVEWSGDLGDRQFWYDGKSVTLYDPATPFYATDAAPPDIDAMLDKVVDATRLRAAAGRLPVWRPVSCRAWQRTVRVRSRDDRRERTKLPHTGLCRKGH